MPNYTPDIDKVLTLAKQQALSRHASLIEEIDILAGTIELDNFSINQLLNNKKISKNELLAEIKKYSHPGTQTDPIPAPSHTGTQQDGAVTTRVPSSASAPGHTLTYNPSTKNLFDSARKESEKLSDDITGALHLFLAFSHSQEPSIQNIFRKFNLDYEDLFTAAKKLSTSSQTPFLDKFGEDLTVKAELGKLDDVIGRSPELEQMIEILARRRKNNPLLYGEAGVGKTAIVEGLANLIHRGQAPAILTRKRIVGLSMNSIIAGAKHRGEFEDRLKNIIQETKNAGGRIILFIDEIHAIVSNESTEEAANILKPVLARGEIQVIGATTVKEYHKYFEKDAALERRFQPVYIKEPSTDECFFILKGIKEKYERFHGVAISDDMVSLAIRLSQRYINQRFLPDKAIDLLDEACAALNIPDISGQGLIAEKQSILTYEKSKTQSDQKKIARLENELQQLEQNSLTAITNQAAATNTTNLKQLTPEIIYKIVERSTGISHLHLAQNDQEKILNLETNLKKHIIGQTTALTALASAIKRNRAGLNAPNRPIGSFLFMGATGVGKTETAKVLAAELFGSRDAIVRIDMSEYMEKHAEAKLIGAPPGYIGYEEGGQLTEKIRTRPYTIVLFDEIEKAHPDVLNLLLQILDEGHLTDNQGHKVNFKNTIIICTSNLGTELDPNTMKSLSIKEKREKMLPYLQKVLKNELINRLDELIYFDSLDQSELTQILELLLSDLNTRLTEKNLALTLSDSAKQQLITLGYDPAFGARPLRRTLQNELETPLAELIIQNKFIPGSQITADFQNNQFTFR